MPRHAGRVASGVLSIAPMNLARAAYHEQSLGQGLDDCYSERGERPGFMFGHGRTLICDWKKESKESRVQRTGGASTVFGGTARGIAERGYGRSPNRKPTTQ